MSSFEYRIGGNQDYDAVYAFLLDHFRVMEPITTSLNASRDDVLEFFSDLRDGGLKNNQYSTVVYEGNDLVAICLCAVKSLESSTADLKMLDPYRDFAKDISAGPYQSRNANRLVCFVDTMEEDMTQLLGPGRVFKIEVMCVRKDRQGQGLASSLVRRCLSIAAQSGCLWIATTATAVASQALFTKAGFGTLRELPFSCFREDGVPVYSNLPDGGRCGKLMAIRIEPETKAADDATTAENPEGVLREDDEDDLK